MANTLGLNGAQPQAQTRFAPIYTGRWSSGLWTNRSPLRDATTARWQEKFYGAAGDALIGGLNAEITNRLTLARRPGNSVFDSNSYSTVGRFNEFRLFSTTTEQIDVMVDQANALYSLFNGTKSLVWTKSTNAGQSYMQAVGNSLYFGNGIDNKKWLQTLNVWSANRTWNTGVDAPFLQTYIIDPNGNVQQLLAKKLTNITNVAYTSSTNVLTLTVGSTSGMVAGDLQTAWGLATATWLNGLVLKVLTAVSTTVTASILNSNHQDYASAADTGTLAIAKGGTPVSAGSQPTWSTTVPSSGNNFQGGITVDNTAVWVNRGLPTENWGLVAPAAPTAAVGSSRIAWAANTFYSFAGVIVDSNGNLQQVSIAGKSGSSTPTWATVVGNTTTDGTITWTMIQTAASLTWAAHTHYATGAFLKVNASGVTCLFQLLAPTTPYLNGTINVYGWNSSSAGGFNKTYPAPAADFTLTAQSLNWANNTGQNTQINTMNGAGEVTGQTDTGHYENWEAAITGTLHIPVAGQYSFTLTHDDGAFMSFGNGATRISGAIYNPVGQTQTAKLGFSPIVGQNAQVGGSPSSAPGLPANPSSPWTITTVWNFPTVGDYQFEIDWTNYQHASQMLLTCNGQQIVNLTAQQSISGATQPVFPTWSTSYAPNYPTVGEAANQYVWQNLGPIVDYTWHSSTNFTLPNSSITDANGNTEAPYRTGVTGSTAPTFATGLNQLTNDNPNLTWINTGAGAAPPAGTVSTFNGGWQYGIALVNTLDTTVSNLSQLTPSTGNFVGVSGVSFTPGSGLNLSTIDPQADYVAIFRTTDGKATPFLIPGNGNSVFTVTLADYLANGYVDNVTDQQLNNLISAPIAGENTPPAPGAINLTYHLNRIFFSVGNVVYWTAGPDTPVGNGVNGVPPANFDTLPSLVKRIVPTAIGVLIFTVSDIYIIVGNGTKASPIQSAQPFLQGIGLLSYNALDINGSIVGFFTTDNQFVILDPSSGVSYAGFPIGNQLRLNNGGVGTSWNSSNVYVAWHVSGEDQGWYIADGATGWYRLMTTPAPETGYTWSPFAQISGGCKAVQSVEVTPGVHKLLLGPTGTGSLLQRDLTVFTDNGTAYTAYAILGSIVLAEPGQIAEVAHITIDSIRVGTPTVLGVIMDEAYPYYTGPFESLSQWETDPVNLPKSSSILGQRFYLASLSENPPVCRHMQIQVNFAQDTVQNELLTLTVFGAYLQEK